MACPCWAWFRRWTPSSSRPETFVRDATSTVPGAWSRLAEAYRSLRTTILLSRAGTPPQVILVSSAKPSEGKTSITTLEAIVFALNGARVLLDRL